MGERRPGKMAVLWPAHPLLPTALAESVWRERSRKRVVDWRHDSGELGPPRCGMSWVCVCWAGPGCG
ncbi:hypothetical protein ACFLIM_19240 [Nonomuraea sp. M3C6]|uniref:Uncharacterized protein n=1 Tax=Nonomuraea marmarensis TaxID=3351344 RepID=A0ABW7AE47_9ACTN